MNDESYDKMLLVIDMEKSQRKPNRIAGYDYSQNGAYFITICTQDRKKILSKISVDQYVIMPDHIHLLVTIHDSA